MVKEFNSLEEIQKYYDEETNTYVFKEDEDYIDLINLNFELNIEANIEAIDIIAWNIIARDIRAWDIKAFDIKAWDIKTRDINAYGINARNIYARDIIAGDIIAHDISYFAVCVVYENIKCNSIKGRRENAKHFVIDGTLKVEEND